MPHCNHSLFFRLFVVVALCLNVSLVSAITVPDLYTAEVPVASEAGLQRAQVMSQAFKQVLIKVSGNSQLIQQKTIVAELSSPQAIES